MIRAMPSIVTVAVTILWFDVVMAWTSTTTKFPAVRAPISRVAERILLPALHVTNDDEDEEDVETEEKPRKLFGGWMGSADNSPLVESIRVEDDDEEDVPPKVVRAKTDRLFAGMPGLNEILADPMDASSSSAENDDGDDGKDPSKMQLTPSVDDGEDDSWFDTERDNIVEKYEEILRNMMEQLEQERRADADNVPENADALIESVLQQELETELETTKQQRERERLEKYEEKMLVDVEEQEIGSVKPTEYVQDLMDKTEAERQQQESSRLEIEDFLRYEQEAQIAQSDDSTIQLPDSTEDLDQWAMDRLQDMEDAREDSDGDEMIRDILQENMDDLATKMREKDEKSSEFQPESLKEWQMYRSIATKIGNGDEQGGGMGDDSNIREQLDSWRGYIEQEQQYRRDSGLTADSSSSSQSRTGPETESADESANVASPESRKQQRIETWKTLNRMSIEALESLCKTADAGRKVKLQEEIAFLKARLEGNDYLDVDESMLGIEDPSDDIPAGPIDSDSLFQTFSADEFDSDKKADVVQDEAMQLSPETPEQPVYVTDDESFDESLPVARPNTAFFEDETDASPPPETPFFSDEEVDTNLGSMEDQKLEAMYRKAGARTDEEREALRAQWEDFQKFEDQTRLDSGLTLEEGADLSAASMDLNYNISSVMKGDGDFDADAILSSIGPRPTRTKKRKLSALENAQSSDAPVISDIDREELADSMYRAVSAVGGGRYRDDPLEDAKQKASFQEFKEKEAEMRKSMDDDDPPTVANVEESPLDDDGMAYAEEVLSNLGPRPQVKRARVIDPEDFSDQGGVLSGDDVDDDPDDDIPDEFSLGLVPEWLRKETEEAKAGTGAKRTTFRGQEIDESINEEDYERNMRQLGEFQRRRSGRSKPIGIDISDVLGRRDSDDYGDFRFDEDYSSGRRSNWGPENFMARKRDLLEYLELEVEQVNSLIDFKESVHTTGVSRYLPRINKPFGEFGAIFQLEGVLLDVTGLHMRAWTKVAKQFDFKEPFREDVERAAVTNPEVAVREVFFWTDDIFECRKIAIAHRDAIKETFDEWMQKNSISQLEARLEPSDAENVVAVEESQLASSSSAGTPLDESTLFQKLSTSWRETAGICEKPPPRDEDIMLAASVTPDIAVTRIFRWTSNLDEVDRIVSVFQQTANPVASNSEEPKIASEPTKAVLTREDVMELHYKAWCAVADALKVDPPTVDEVLAAFVFNDSQVAVEGFGWNESIQSKASTMFQTRLDELLSQSGFGPTANSAAVSMTEASAVPPDFEEIFQQAMDAWTATAKEGKLEAPTGNQVMLALSVGPEDAIRRGFNWASAPEEVEGLVNVYLTELGRIQKKGGAKSPDFKVKKAASPENKTIGPSDDEVFKAVFEAWTSTAKQLGYDLPDEDEVVFAITVGGEEGIKEGFQWTDDPETVTEILDVYRAEIGKKRSKWDDPSQNTGGSASIEAELPIFIVRDGAALWVQSLLNVEMKCSVVSYLEEYQLNVLLEQAGLDDLLVHRVSASKGYPTLPNKLLGAALQMERRPDHCVLFDCTPYGSVAAHDVEMQSVSFVGAYPRYELLAADSTAASFDLLTAMNIRRLFGERIYDQPQIDTEQNQPANIRSRRTKTKYFFDDD